MKKRILSIVLTIVFALTSFAQNILTGSAEKNTSISLIQTENTIEITQDFDYLSIEKTFLNNSTYYQISMGEGFSSSNQIGKANLPQYNSLISIPVCEAIEIEEDVLETETIQLKNNISIAPCQASQSKQNEEVPFTIDERYYSQTGFSEELYTKVNVLGFMGGTRLARLEVCPIKYDPSSNTIKVVRKIKVNIKFKNIEPTAAFQGGKAVEEFLGNKLLNKTTEKIAGSNTTPTPYVLVVLAPDEFRNTLQSFISWKKQQGFLVIEAYTSQIGSDTTSIRNYLRNLYNDQSTPTPDYLLICGDTPQIPTFKGRYGGYYTHYTDLYYADYTSDLIPDVFFGRMSARDTNTLASILNKTITYEKYLMSDDSYLNRTLLVAGKETSSPAPTVTNGQVNYAKEYIADYADTNVYYNPASGNQAGTVLAKINQGQGWVNYTAHCDTTGWYSPAIRTSTISQFTNTGMYGVFVNNCCMAGKFDAYETFSEKLLKAENKGAVASIAASDYTYWDEDYYWAVGNKSATTTPQYMSNHLGAYDRLFHTHSESRNQQYTTVGQIFVGGNLAVAESGSSLTEYYWEVYNLQGDPTLLPYIGKGQEMRAEYSHTNVLGITSLDIITEPYAYVSLTMADSLIDVKEADENGLVTLDVSGVTEPSDLILVMTAQFFKPVIDTILFISSTEPFIVINDINVRENGSEENVSVIKENTSYNIAVKIKNEGAIDFVSSNETLSLTLLDSSSNMIESCDTFLALTPLGAGNQSAYYTFSFTTAKCLADGSRFCFSVSVNGDGYTRTKYRSFDVVAPVLNIDNLELYRRNDTIDITFDLQNNGSYPTQNGLLEINDLVSAEQVGVINPMESLTKGFSYVNTEDLDTLNFEIVYTAGNYQVKDNVCLSIKEKLEDFETKDFSKLNWIMDSDNPWEIDTVISYEGIASARSKKGLAHSATSSLSLNLNVMEDDSISFYVKTSTQRYYDILYFTIDGITRYSTSGEFDWIYKSIPIAKGEHTIKWAYQKNGVTTSGEDAVWVDNIKLPVSGSQEVVVALEDIQQTDVRVYPNPATDLINIEGLETNTTLEICDQMGRVVYVRKANKQNEIIDISSLTTGVYYLIVRNSNAVSKNKILISK